MIKLKHTHLLVYNFYSKCELKTSTFKVNMGLPLPEGWDSYLPGRCGLLFFTSVL